VKILRATIASFAFSIAVILCTVGLMDGFDYLLKSGLRHSSGDILISSQRGFFTYGDRLRGEIDTISPLSEAAVIQTEAFALNLEKSKGVLVRGVEEKNFSEATGLDLTLETNGIAIGKELAKELCKRRILVAPGEQRAQPIELRRIDQASALTRRRDQPCLVPKQLPSD
jgi:ABC-type lipoprotein release transport system permease subunit